MTSTTRPAPGESAEPVPSVDVLLPVRAPAPWFREAISSLASQSFSDVQLVLVIHGDDAGFTAIAEASGLRLTIGRAPTAATLPEVLNTGLGLCTAEFVARLDADDVAHPTRLQDQLDFLISNPDVAVVGSAASLIDDAGNPTGVRAVPTDPDDVLRRMRWRNALIHPSVMFRRDVIAGLNGYDTDADNVEDYELWMRVLEHHQIAALPQALIAYRIHDHQVTKRSIASPGAATAVNDARLGLALRRGESVGAARMRQRIWATRQSMRSPTASLRESATGYLALLFAGIAIGQLLQYFWPTTAFFKGQNPAIILQLLLIPPAVALWIVFRNPERRSRSLSIFLGLLLGNFALQMALLLVRGEFWNYTAALLPIALALIWLKPPTFRAVMQASDIFAWAIIGICLVAQLAVRLDLVVSRNYFNHRYFEIAQWLGVPWRWEGPFGSVNWSGPIGAYLLVYGLSRPRGRRLIFTVSGVLIMLASESRGGFAAAAVGVCTYLLCRPRIGAFTWSPVRRIVAIGGIIIVFAVSVALFDPTLNGRSSIWSSYWDFWQNTPALGANQLTIDAALASGQLNAAGIHSHNLLVEVLARSGLIGLLATLALLVAGAVIVWRANRAGMAMGLALFAAFVAASMAEVFTSWIYLSVQVLPMLIAVLAGAAWLSRTSPEANAGRVGPTHPLQ